MLRKCLKGSSTVGQLHATPPTPGQMLPQGKTVFLFFFLKSARLTATKGNLKKKKNRHGDGYSGCQKQPKTLKKSAETGANVT